MKVPAKVLNTYILNSCFSKKPYATQDEAEEEARKIAARFRTKTMKVYSCKVCNKYHLTNKSNKIKHPENVNVSNMKCRSNDKYKDKRGRKGKFKKK